LEKWAKMVINLDNHSYSSVYLMKEGQLRFDATKVEVRKVNNRSNYTIIRNMDKGEYYFDVTSSSNWTVMIGPLDADFSDNSIIKSKQPEKRSKTTTLKEKVIGKYIMTVQHTELTISNSKWSSRSYSSGRWVNHESGSYSFGKEWWSHKPEQYNYIELHNFNSNGNTKLVIQQGYDGKANTVLE
jgi:hypothetical protein